MLKCTLTTPNGFVFLCSSAYLVNKSGLFGFQTNEPNRYEPVESLAEVMQSEIYTLDHFKDDCKAEELTQGQHLVILIMNTSLEKDSQASSVQRVYYPFGYQGRSSRTHKGFS